MLGDALSASSLRTVVCVALAGNTQVEPVPAPPALVVIAVARAPRERNLEGG